MPTLRPARLHYQALCLISATLFASAALAAGSGTSSQANAGAQAQYKTDVAKCKAGQTNQDRATCMREAGAALEEAKRNRLSNGTQSYDQNKLKRCQALPAADQQDCLTQMSNQNTTTEGSALGGGVLRETTITVPPSPAPTAPATGTVTAPGATPARIQ